MPESITKFIVGFLETRQDCEISFRFSKQFQALDISLHDKRTGFCVERRISLRQLDAAIVDAVPFELETMGRHLSRATENAK